MRLLPSLAVMAGVFLAAQSTALASITINIYAGSLRNASGSANVAQGTLIQLINLGNDGFNPININDGSSSGLAQWVSGNDAVIAAAFVNPAAGDFTTGAAFDLTAGADPTTGILNRAFRFEIADVPAGTNIGIRWFPGILAANFATTTLVPGQAYGQFTRAASALHNGSVWISPSDGGTLTFDALSTQNNPEGAGSDPNSAGFASFTVVPEPAAIGLSLLGAVGLATLRRRRS